MKATMTTAASNLNNQIKKMGDGWTWVKCEVGYVVHQGEIPLEQRGRAWWGLNAFKNPVFIGKTCSLASVWASPI